MIRQAIKAILHLPISTMSEDFFYLPMKEGGLGLQSLSEGVDFGMLNLYRKLSGSSDSAVRAAADLWFNQCRRSHLARKRDVADLTERGLAQAKAAVLERHRSKFAATYQGSGHREHDVVVRKLASLAEEGGFRVTDEPALRHEDQAYKPDLIASSDSLARRYAENCRKYQPLSDQVCKLTGATEYATGSIVIGARGAWCSRNDETLKAMKWAISDKLKALLCLMTLERTNQLVSWFMRSTDALAFRRSGDREHEGKRHLNPAVASPAHRLATQQSPAEDPAPHKQLGFNQPALERSGTVVPDVPA
uniref:Uncharacterized protein n=1 Tax=Trichuris muris TaxID=70415 RepID=A0A5S6QSL3_TRIMR